MKHQCVYFILLLKILFVNCQEEYCYSNDADKKQTKQFATKTPYEVAHGTEKNNFIVHSKTRSMNYLGNLQQIS